MTTRPYFDSIRKRLLEAIEKANSHIYIAVCWFTNDDLFNALCRKLETGVFIELIILDDYINSNYYGCDFSKFINLGGHLYLSHVERPMHNKYCVIDNKTLINGSYNWTYFAETKNEENIVIFENCNDLISAFNKDFERLKGITVKVDKYEQKPLLKHNNLNNESKARNVFSSFNMLSNDLFIKALETRNKSFYEAAKSIMPDNIAFQKKAVEYKWDQPVKLIATLSESIINDRINVIFPKDTVIPNESFANFTTIRKEQQEMEVNILKGESQLASLNKKLLTYVVEKIPSLEVGEASIRTEYKISTDGILYINKHIHNTGLIDKKFVDLKRFKLLQYE